MSINIRDLSLSFGDVKVLEKLNLDISEGEFIVLLGPSGCGKSTLLNCIAGLLDINEGQIYINNENVTWAEPNERGIGMVFQSYALYPQMTVAGNLSFGLKNAGLPKEEIDKRIEKTAKLLHIETLLERKPQALSGGQRQRVAIGRALVRDVNVFLFDEPLSNLDAKLRAELRVEIKRLHQQLENNTMVYVTHDQIEALTLADRIAVMRDGLIQQLADPHTIYNKPNNIYVASFIGSPSMNFIDAKLAHVDGKLCCSFADLNLDLSNYSASSDTQLSGGRDVILGLRPEHISLGEHGPNETVLGTGTVELEEPMGADVLFWVQLGGNSIGVRTDASTPIKQGQQVSVAVDLPFASLFDKQDESRL